MLKRMSACALAAFPLAVCAQYVPPNLPEPYSAQSISIVNAASAMLEADKKYADSLTTQQILDYLNDPRNIEKLIQKALEALRKKVLAIAADNSKTQSQKRDAVNLLVDDSILPYESAPTGIPQASYRYSLESGIARIMFNATVRDDQCATYAGVAYGSGVVYGVTRIKRVPNVYIYREIEGAPTELVLKVDSFGASRAYNVSYPISFSDPWSSLWGAYRTYRTSQNPAAMVSRPALDIPTSLYLKAGRRLSYVVDVEYTEIYDCGWFFDRSRIAIDADGDGKVDIVPAAEYQKHAAKVWAPLAAPVFATLFD